MAIYVLKQCDECGIVLRMLPSETTIGEAWTCPACQQVKREDWIKEIVDAVARGYRPQIGDGLVDLAKASYDEIKIEAGRVWSWHNAGAPVEQAQPEPLTGAQQVDPRAGGTDQECATERAPVSLGFETAHETQSGHNRLQHATALIIQMPQSHDGRGTWLMNYAQHRDPKVQALIRTRPRAFATMAEAEQAADHRRQVLSREEMIEYIETQHAAGYTRYYNAPPSCLSAEALIVEWDSAANWAGDA